MDDFAFTAYLTACTISCTASQLLAKHQGCLRRSQEQVALSRKLLAQPVYPHGFLPPHDPFDFSGLEAVEPSE
jgi:hypothetical protein